VTYAAYLLVVAAAVVLARSARAHDFVQLDVADVAHMPFSCD
jgi:hypothetical protein